MYVYNTERGCCSSLSFFLSFFFFVIFREIGSETKCDELMINLRNRRIVNPFRLLRLLLRRDVGADEVQRPASAERVDVAGTWAWHAHFARGPLGHGGGAQGYSARASRQSRAFSSAAVN